ncbi:hypothetical protein LTR85_008260 [Meristemomyces frigidus]|nr:hypothetical protein LTR85_008260 [Meristemomyces frigidus]
MKHFLALPALLRTSLLLASASQNTFSVQDDLLAFPQYEVKFSDDYISEQEAQALLHSHVDLNAHAEDNGVPPAQIEQYRPQPTPSDGNNKKDEPKLEHEYMVLDRQLYLCSIPQVEKPTADASARNDTLTKREEEKELARATDRGWELLSGMQGNCMYFISGWWSYRFCYGQGVKQFHQLPPNRGVPVYPPVEDPSVEGFELGNYVPEEPKKVGGAESDDETVANGKDGRGDGWEGESALDVSEGAKVKHRPSGYGELVQRGESRYLVQRLAGGTKCDLTGKDRRIEVQFHCNPQSSDRIHLIKETSTCAYLMVIQTPRLCNDVAFLPPQKDQPNAISCAPILAEDEVEDYERDLKALNSAEKAAKVWEANAEGAAALGAGDAGDTDYDIPENVQIVGDIVVGAHTLVPPGKKIEKGAIVGGGKETYIDTVASSDGKTLSKEDMEKLGLGDPKAVEKLREELEKIAGGEVWKLDVIDTPRGREYRGIIGGEDEDGKKAGDAKGKKGGKNEGGEKEKEGQGGASPDDDQGQDGSQEEYYKEEL